MLRKLIMTGALICMLTACNGGATPNEPHVSPDNGAAADPSASATPPETQTPAPPPIETALSAPGAGHDFNDPPPPAFSNVSVHDPSVFPADNGYYYVMGSHLAAARTADFMEWTQLTHDWRGTKNIFYPKDNPDPNVQTMEEQSADVLRGAENALGFFAGDIHCMPDGRYFHYYCLTASWKCSAIGVAISDSGADGPYVTQGLLLRSAMAGENRTPDGTDTWTERKYPNCIDPQAFFCQDGRFWMTYGSWSGGIFLSELDPKTGLLADNSAINRENGGYGRLLISGAHASIEGPYILYAEGYYYLFVSYGGLASDGGYNIRVFRSRDVAGPYEDGVHADAAEKRLTNPGAQDYGVKLMGGYQFRHEDGEPGRTTGYLSPGHNSAYYDAETERYYLIFHTRFSERGEGHEVRVHEFFINKNGWPVVAPFRYDGGAARTFTPEQLIGGWKLINHRRLNNTIALLSRTVHFQPDGTVTGEWDGAWELGADGKTACITVDGKQYDGLFLRCWDNDNNMWVQAFTALSSDGEALWGAGVALATP